MEDFTNRAILQNRYQFRRSPTDFYYENSRIWNVELASPYYVCAPVKSRRFYIPGDVACLSNKLIIRIWNITLTLQYSHWQVRGNVDRCYRAIAHHRYDFGLLE